MTDKLPPYYIAEELPHAGPGLSPRWCVVSRDPWDKLIPLLRNRIFPTQESAILAARAANTAYACAGPCPLRDEYICTLAGQTAPPTPIREKHHALQRVQVLAVTSLRLDGSYDVQLELGAGHRHTLTFAKDDLTLIPVAGDWLCFDPPLPTKHRAHKRKPY